MISVTIGDVVSVRPLERNGDFARRRDGSLWHANQATVVDILQPGTPANRMLGDLIVRYVDGPVSGELHSISWRQVV